MSIMRTLWIPGIILRLCKVVVMGIASVAVVVRIVVYAALNARVVVNVARLPIIDEPEALTANSIFGICCVQYGFQTHGAHLLIVVAW